MNEISVYYNKNQSFREQFGYSSLIRSDFWLLEFTIRNELFSVAVV